MSLGGGGGKLMADVTVGFPVKEQVITVLRCFPAWMMGHQSGSAETTLESENVWRSWRS